MTGASEVLRTTPNQPSSGTFMSSLLVPRPGGHHPRPVGLAVGVDTSADHRGPLRTPLDSLTVEKAGTSSIRLRYAGAVPAEAVRVDEDARVVAAGVIRVDPPAVVRDGVLVAGVVDGVAGIQGEVRGLTDRPESPAHHAAALAGRHLGDLTTLLGERELRLRRAVEAVGLQADRVARDGRGGVGELPGLGVPVALATDRRRADAPLAGPLDGDAAPDGRPAPLAVRGQLGRGGLPRTPPAASRCCACSAGRRTTRVPPRPRGAAGSTCCGRPPAANQSLVRGSWRLQ